MMNITITVDPSQKNEATEYYESLGMSLVSVQKIDRQATVLTFSCDKDLGAQILQHDSSAQGSLSFEDGSSSPLYVRRGPSWD